MADVATPSAATMATIDAGAEHPVKASKPKPEKPDEEAYKEALRNAEQENSKAQEKLVCLLVAENILGSMLNCGFANHFDILECSQS